MTRAQALVEIKRALEHCFPDRVDEILDAMWNNRAGWDAKILEPPVRPQCMCAVPGKRGVIHRRISSRIRCEKPSLEGIVLCFDHARTGGHSYRSNGWHGAAHHAYQLLREPK